MVIREIGELIREQQMVTVPVTASVLDAAKCMADGHVGAVPVMQNGRLVGIFTERDLLNRVVAAGKNPATLSVADVMTPDPTTIQASDTLVNALDLMFDNAFRHLPVLDDARSLVGIMSCRDVPATYQVLRERWIKARTDHDIAA
jgi:CBS domain-containing protein